DARFSHEPRGGGLDALLEVRFELAAQPRHARRELIAPSGGFTQPEGDGGRLAACILDTDAPLLDAQNAVGHVAELENIALQALDGEVLVHRADELRLRLENHLVVGGIRNRAAGGDGGEACAAPAFQPSIDGIVIDEGAMATAARGEPLG